MSRNATPRMVRATGASDAHGRIFDPKAGAMYVHLHRESGLAHRSYVLRPWQVRLLGIALSRPMILLYVVAVVTWGLTATQALRVPLLQRRVAELTHDAQRLDTLTATLTELQARYEQVQRMLGAQSAAAGVAASAPGASPPAAPSGPTRTSAPTTTAPQAVAPAKTAPPPGPRDSVSSPRRPPD